MGLFDDIYFEKPPIENCENIYFQTKSLDCMMKQYKVTVDGKFQEEIVEHREPKPEEQTEICGVKVPFMIREHKGWKDSEFTGEIHCYDYVDGIWHDIYLVIIYGKVDKMEVSEKRLNESQEN